MNTGFLTYRVLAIPPISGIADRCRWEYNQLIFCAGSCFKVFAVGFAAYGPHPTKGTACGSLEKENKFLSTNSFHWRMLLPWEPTSSILFFPFKCLNSLNIKKLALQQALCHYRSSQHSTDILERRGFLQAQGLSTIKWELPDLGHFLGVSQTTEMWSATTPPRFGITEDLHFVKLEFCSCSWGGLEVNTRIQEGQAAEGHQVFRKCSHLCFRLFLSFWEDCWKCRDWPFNIHSWVTQLLDPNGSKTWGLVLTPAKGL